MTASTVASVEPTARVIVVPDGGTAVPVSHVMGDAVAIRAPSLQFRWAAEAALRVLRRGMTAAVPRWPLLVVMAVVTVLAARLMMTNTAFMDEGTYITAGHTEWMHWLHGGPGNTFAGYFSGSPVIYPPLVAAADALGGLVLARTLSLGFMLVTLAVLYATAKRMFDARTAGWAVAIFATVNGTQFLAAFATYDAMALMLLALAVWVAIRYAYAERDYPHAGLLLGVPLLAFANATKYATALFDPVVVLVVTLVVWDRYGRREAARIAGLFTGILVALICAAVAMAGQNYEVGIRLTTLNRVGGDATPSQVIDQSVKWVGWLALLSLVTVVGCVMSWLVSRRTGGERRLTASHWLVIVLAAAITLVPFEQAHIGTTVALHKHLTFGGWFAAIAIGVLLSRASGSVVGQWWRWVPVLGAVSWLVLAGHRSAQESFHAWPNTTQLMTSIEPYLEATADKPALMDDADVARYYLHPAGHDWLSTFTPTYYLAYQPPRSSTLLHGKAAYRAAIADDHFGLVALNFAEATGQDRAIQNAVEANPDYQYLGRVHVHDVYGNSSFKLWLDMSPAVTR